MQLNHNLAPPIGVGVLPDTPDYNCAFLQEDRHLSIPLSMCVLHNSQDIEIHTFFPFFKVI